MKTSVCITILNEENTISNLLNALLKQTLKVNEIIIADGGSTDNTLEIIRYFVKKNKRIRILKKKCSRAKGRNLAVKLAKNSIIAMTDGGCVPEINWLEKITIPFLDSEVDVVAGFYRMKTNNNYEKAESAFLGTLPSKFGVNFMPSTRSVAFRKDIWEKVDGFPEKLEGAAEDTAFNYKLIKNKAKIARMKTAVVEWGMPKNLIEFYKKIFNYAKGDASSKILIFPTKGFSSHNIKVLLVFVRYLFFLLLFCLHLIKNFSPVFLLSILLIYSAWAFRKIHKEFKEVKPSLWGIILQFTADFGVMAGFVSGLLSKKD